MANYLNIKDTYQGLENPHPTVRAGTEELNFMSYTGTYNRDGKHITELCKKKTGTSETTEPGIVDERKNK